MTRTPNLAAPARSVSRAPARLRSRFGGARRVPPALLPGLLLLLPFLWGCEGDGREAPGPGGFGMAMTPGEVPPGGRVPDGLRDRPELLALEALRGGDGVEALVEAAASDDPELRARAVYVLAGTPVAGREDRVESTLLALLHDPVPAVRAEAALALAVLPLQWGVRGGRGEGVEGPADPAVARALALRLAEEGDKGVRIRLLQALGIHGGEEDFEALLAQAESGGWEPGTDGADGTGEGAALLAALARLSLGSDGAQGVGDPHAVARVMARALSTGEPPLAREAVAWLAHVPDPDRFRDEAEGLRPLVPDDPGAPWDAVAHQAWVALQRWWGPRDRDRGLRLLEHDDEAVRIAAARAFDTGSRVEGPGVREALWRAFVEDPSPAVARAAAAPLYRGLRIPGWVLDAARGYLEGEHPEPVRARSLLPLLALRDDPGVVERWTRARLADDPEGAAAGVRALAPIGDPPLTPFLFEVAAHADPVVRTAGVRALVGRWDLILADEEELLRYVERFSRAAVEGRPVEATAGIRALANPIFLEYGARETLEGALGGREARGRGELLGREFAEALRFVRTPADAAGSYWGEGAPRIPVPLDEAMLGEVPPGALLRLETDQGVLLLELLVEEAPRASGLLASRARAGSLDGIPFHRVEAGVLVQGGDVVAGDGTGLDPLALPLEPGHRRFHRGVMGVTAGVASEVGVQFFIAGGTLPWLDGVHGAAAVSVGDDVVLARLLDGGGRIVRACVVSRGEAATTGCR